ncbi:uncharacterized protein LOC117180058 isoform X2 [Belonocnema kinseyi]|uniref:uncharacterized protein LOC117180058 isoform X2 n=1 Tax=Belonocnema kinseyi TaxID=2817044 RepID=UPI00143D25E2|nr:uncharacterized protein LOC117180058 isoform X2 [Belonocnema kinseyi]
MEQSSSHNANKTSTSRSEDHHHRLHRARNEETIDRRREAWLIQQEREREHERHKQKMILEYELKRETIVRSQKYFGSLSRQSQDNQRKDCSSQRHCRPSVMSQKLELPNGKTPLFKGPMVSSISTSELRRIKVDIRRNIPGPTATICDLQRDIISPEKVRLKRREDEGMKPIFDRDELKLHAGICVQEEDCQTIKMSDTEKGKRSHSLKQCFKFSCPSKCRSRSPVDSSHRYRPILC